MIKYKINCLELLKNKGLNTNILRQNKILSESCIQYLRSNKIIGISQLDKICKLLEMQPGDIIEYVKEE